MATLTISMKNGDKHTVRTPDYEAAANAVDSMLEPKYCQERSLWGLLKVWLYRQFASKYLYMWTSDDQLERLVTIRYNEISSIELVP